MQTCRRRRCWRRPPISVSLRSDMHVMSRCRRRASAPAESPASSRTTRPPCAPPRVSSRRARRPRCSGPWPSCCPRPTGRTRSCPVERSDRTDPSALSPWCRAPNRRVQRAAHTCRPTPRCSRHWCAPAAGPSRRGSCPSGRCHARPRWPPRTWRRSGCRTDPVLAAAPYLCFATIRHACRSWSPRSSCSTKAAAIMTSTSRPVQVSLFNAKTYWPFLSNQKQIWNPKKLVQCGTYFVPTCTLDFFEINFYSKIKNW